MRWKIAQAKRRFSEVVRRAAAEPQLICNGERVVAAVVDPGSAERLRSLLERESQRSLAEAFSEFRKMVAHNGLGLKIPRRKNRPNIFPDSLDLTISSDRRERSCQRGRARS